MSLSDSSSGLSSPPSSDHEEEPPKPVAPGKTLKLKGGKLTAASHHASPQSSPEPPEPAREPSPPHEYVLADNPDIAFLVMFRARFSDIFPKNVPNLGPQDIERGVVETVPSEQIENFLCALLGLVLNRKKYVERGHYGRALEEAISTQRSQWPKAWAGSNPLPGTKTFADLNPTERLELLKTLVLWALNTSEIITSIIKESYKNNRAEDDLNQPLSIQPWGTDGRKRRYWLIEGQNDTPFRLYRESAPRLVNRTWWSVAGSIDELKAVGDNLRAEGGQAARRLADSISGAIPRLEETQEKRKKKDYRQARRAAFLRPEPGYSLYEGRTRGKKMKYTFSDEEDLSDSNSIRRSTRHSNGSASGEPNGPTVTASGRHVRSRFGRSYGEPLGQSREGTAAIDSSEAGEAESSRRSTRTGGRPQRSSARGLQKRNRNGYSSDEELGDDDGNDTDPSGEEWQGDDDDVEGKLDQDENENDSSDASDDSLMDYEPSLVITLRYKNPANPSYEAAEPTSRNLQSMLSAPDGAQKPSSTSLQSPPVAHRPKINTESQHVDSEQTRLSAPTTQHQPRMDISNLIGQPHSPQSLRIHQDNPAMAHANGQQVRSVFPADQTPSKMNINTTMTNPSSSPSGAHPGSTSHSSNSSTVQHGSFSSSTDQNLQQNLYSPEKPVLPPIKDLVNGVSRYQPTNEFQSSVSSDPLPSPRENVTSHTPGFIPEPSHRSDGSQLQNFGHPKVQYNQYQTQTTNSS